MNTFETKFNKRRKMFNAFFIFNLVVIAFVAIAGIYIGYHVLSNPESIGEFFGKILKGVNNAK